MPRPRPSSKPGPDWLAAKQIGEPLSAEIPAFTDGVAALTWGERFDVLDAWVAVLDGLYAHLPLKRAMYGFDPIRALEHLRQQVPDLTDLQFHRELTTLINRLRDAHTQYTGPTLVADAVATLPFLVEMFGPSHAPSYVVTKVNRQRVSEAAFEPGVTLEFWNGVPFDRAVDVHAEVETGGRPDARRARALESLTFRALGYAPPPDERWVIVGYRDLAGRAREIRLDWRTVFPGRSPKAAGTRTSRARRAINQAAEAVRRAKKLLFNAELWAADQQPVRSLHSGKAVATQYDDFVTARNVVTSRGRFGYLRIWSFDVDDDQEFLDATIARLKKLSQRGLIIDLRDNPGGFIWAAERMLQLFTPSTITPTKFALRATPLTAAMAATAFNQAELGPWAASLTDAPTTGEPYSSHLPITSIEQCNNIGQCYGGPVMAVVDANTYSSGDLFTAGIVDNRIGPVVCIGQATGAGGANVWTSDDVRSAMLGTERPLAKLPRGANFTIAVRRAVRSGDADGVLIEDTGIAGQPYAMTQNDLLGHNEDLLNYCGELLANRPVTIMRAMITKGSLSVETKGLDRLDVYADGHPVGSSIEVRRDGTRSIRIPAIGIIEVVGYAGSVIRQRRRLRTAS